MSGEKFTKGEWVAFCPKDLLNFGHVSVETESGKLICFREVYKTTLEEQTANAYLIAAAPEMYDFIETYMGGHPEAEMLLAKARGENV